MLFMYMQCSQLCVYNVTNLLSGLKPTEKYLRRLFIIKYTLDWRNIGLELNIASEALDTIEANNPKKVLECCIEMLKFWLQQDSEASWEKLFHAIEAAGKSYDSSSNVYT